jgi:hypothetical protein
MVSTNVSEGDIVAAKSAQRSLRLRKMNEFSTFRYRVEIRNDEGQLVTTVPFGNALDMVKTDAERRGHRKQWTMENRDRIALALSEHDIYNPVIVEWRVLWIENTINLGLLNLYNWLRLTITEMRKEVESLEF